MKPSKLVGGLRRSAMLNVCVALLALAAAALSPVQAQCPTGQKLMQAQVPTGVVRIVPVPASASNFPSGLVVRPGFRFVMTAVGSIRVGVFGETGTSPDGWVPQGPAGPGFPDPDSYTFSLLYRIGPAGSWQLLGSGESVAVLGPHDVPGSQVLFGINDNDLGNNSGMFLVTMTEFTLGTKCGVPVQLSGPGYIFNGSSGTSSGTVHSTTLPCAGLTSNGRAQSFPFQMMCAAGVIRPDPQEACTRAQALSQAQAQAKSDLCTVTSN